MKVIKVDTKLGVDGNFHCWTNLPIVGRVCVSTGTDEYKAQHQAARFLDANYPDLQFEWIGGYHGGDTSSKTGDMPGHYNDR